MYACMCVGMYNMCRYKWCIYIYTYVICIKSIHSLCVYNLWYIFNTHKIYQASKLLATGAQSKCACVSSRSAARAILAPGDEAYVEYN